MRPFLCRLAGFVFLSWPLCGWPLFYWEQWNGCVGCGMRFGDVLTAPSEGAPRGEHYCWRCADDHLDFVEYRILRAR